MEEEPAYRDTDVVNPKENVTGEANTDMHMVTVRIKVVSAKRQR